jgi:integrase
MRHDPDRYDGSEREHMVVRVRLEGLKIVKGRRDGTWYVYRRSTMEPLLKGFEGTREDLLRKLGEPDLMHAFNRPRLHKRLASDFAQETLGGFAYWYTNGDIDRLSDPKHLKEPGELPDGYPKWRRLAEATRKDYLAACDYLREDFDVVLRDIRQPDLYEARDKCANRKWPRFADKMISALSSMFKQAVRRGKMDFNPCLGMDDAHEADPQSNREWFAPEWKFARENAPLEVLIPMMLARYAGLRGQTIVGINRKQFEDHPDGPTGKAVRYTPRKNRKKVTYVLLPVLPELQEFLAELKVQRTDGLIAVRDDGTVWASEKEMQTRVSHWLRDRERDGLIGAGTTLHGLRVSYAAWWKRTTGASNAEVADLLGDKSEAMGKHYTRHVEAELNIVQAFTRIRGKT